MSSSIYGVVDSDGIHTDVSNTIQGAKNYATRNGYKKISVRYNGGFNAQIVAEKLINGNWKDL